MKFLFSSLMLLTGMLCFAQNSYQSIVLKNELTEQANAILRDEHVLIEIEDVDDMTITTKRVVTVLNKYGEGFVRAYDFYDDGDAKIKSQSALIFNKMGQEIKKFKQRDFKDQSAVGSSNLYSDNRVSYLDYSAMDYPYTVVYESEVNMSTTVFIRAFQPVSSYFLSVASSKYELKNPNRIPIRYIETNLDSIQVEKNINDFELTYTFKDIPAYNYEPYSPEVSDMAPKVKVALNDFSLMGVEGNASDWKAFGKWQYENLLKGRDELYATTIAEVSELVKDAANDYEKAKLIYEYMQSKTRYISVQLGIGGWEPILAQEVDRVGYGDCKGLTNYTKALLASQGIKANYAVVYAGDEQKDIDPAFASMQGNHVILNVPGIAEEDVWLECTSQSIPFNYLGDFTDNRHVLLIKEEGGEIVKTPKYTGERNLEQTFCEIDLSEDAFTATVTRESKGIPYGNNYHIENQKEKDKNIYYKEKLGNLQGIHIDQLKFENNKDQTSFSEQLDFSGKKFHTTAGNRILLPLNFIQPEINAVTKTENRKYPIEIVRGFTNKDQFDFKIPEAYAVEALPDSVKIETDFGKFSFSVKVSDKDPRLLQVKRSISINEGKWSPNQFSDFRAFLNKINILSNQKAVLVKNG
ncbi:DUF3857 domain-containing protein [Zunongwangia endophytica]|uniref:DUF3857 domain-containing protein n=1 Tax=Zunongwangia endophytica TaxID=1808945 RepID=A0ABV8HAM0_9FLAO|nr:DUF3857 domain-containing protein [Zunongwangia endophytica]MDN3595192.1 DUF3857 domain-containing protein [Zunongwangia endophytica]